MKRIAGCLFLILGLISTQTPASAQRLSPSSEYWHTAGVGLSTPMGFNMGASYSFVMKGPFFIQATVSATKDVYITRHSVYAVGPSVGVRFYTNTALTSLSIGPRYIWGTRGADLLSPGTSYHTASMNVIGQVLFREINMGFELYSNLNPIRNVSGVRLIYRLGQFR
ncbi:MAG: hypothetical protein ACE5G0_05060 [Rhodothermales bacterium]